LAGHFDEVHPRVAHAGQVRGEHLNVDLFAAAQGDSEARIVVAIEKLERGSLGGRNEDGDSASGKLPKRGGALLLYIGMGRSTSWAGNRTMRLGSIAPVSSQPARNVGSRASAALLSATIRMTG
jgi:hypothetical protein